jgi:hypothetical protein
MNRKFLSLLILAASPSIGGATVVETFTAAAVVNSNANAHIGDAGDNLYGDLSGGWDYYSERFGTIPYPDSRFGVVNVSGNDKLRLGYTTPEGIGQEMTSISYAVTPGTIVRAEATMQNRNVYPSVGIGLTNDSLGGV